MSGLVRGCLDCAAAISIGARGDAIICAKRAAEMRRVIETPTKTDLADRKVAMSSTREIGPAMLEPPLAQVLAETQIGGLKQFLDVARRDTLLIGQSLQTQIA